MISKIKNHKFLLLSLAALALLSSYVFFNKSNNNAQVNQTADARLVNVTTITIKKQTVQLYQELPARVSAYKISAVRPQIEGIIKEIKFSEGSFIEQGQPLYQIDPTIYQATFNSAKINLKSAQAKFERYKALIKEDAISQQEFDDAAAAFATAEGDFNRAKANLGYTQVYAPISGYIGKSNFTEGALVTLNQADPLTTITQLNPVYVDMVEPSKEAVKLGDQKEIPVTLISDNVSSESSGTLKFTEVFADESTDSVRLRALFSNEDKKLIPGMFVTAKLHLKPFEAITVPQRATSRASDGSLTVWIVEKDNIAKLRKIKADRISGENWIVSDGLTEGDVVIYEGFLKVFDGAKVNPTMLAPEPNTTPTSENKTADAVATAPATAKEPEAKSSLPADTQQNKIPEKSAEKNLPKLNSENRENKAASAVTTEEKK